MPADIQFLLRPSLLALIFVNLVPLGGALFLEWDVFALMVLYWSENVILGVLNLFRMAVATGSSPAQVAQKLFMIPFFTVHYGMFTAGHGLFVVGLFGDRDPGGGLLDVFGTMLDVITSLGLVIPAMALAASHLFSFFFNFLGQGEYKQTSIQALMIKPYGRIIVLHITIIIGGFIAQAMGETLLVLAILVILKTAVDVKAHLKAHRKQTTSPDNLEDQLP